MFAGKIFFSRTSGGGQLPLPASPLLRHHLPPGLGNQQVFGWDTFSDERRKVVEGYKYTAYLGRQVCNTYVYLSVLLSAIMP